MSLFAWCSRRSGGLAMLALIAISYWVISSELDAQRHGYKYHSTDSLSAPTYDPQGAGIWVPVFAYYCLLIHFLVFMFPIRSCWAVFSITRNLQRNAHNKTLKDLKFAHRRRGSSTSLSSSETLTSSRDLGSTSSSEAGDLDPEVYADADIAPDRVIHAIIIPNYKEENDTLRETLEILASHPQARNTYDVYLGMEQRESNADTKAARLTNEFSKKFRSMDYTIHPGDIPNEVAGKGSNVAWAARKLSEKYSIGQRKDVIVTGIDADSHLSANYFALVTNMHLAYPETATTTLYSAPIIFDRNAQNVPAIVRVADILWSAAGMSGLYKGSTIAPPTSVYSLPLELVDRVGGWDCDSEAIGEDLHMYLKCFFALNGNLTVRTVMSPVSQTNVTGGGQGKGMAGIITDMRARYKQAQRHMWGALDTGYALRKVVEIWRERKHTSRAFRPLHAAMDSNSDTYVPEAQIDALGMEAAPESGIFSDVVTDTVRDLDYERIFYLFHRLFEAHFLPVQMTILIVASTLFLWVTEGTADVHGVSWVWPICNVLRTLGFLEVAVYLFLYENFHRICVETREKEMGDAGLLKGMHFSRREAKTNYIDYVMVPLVAPIFGSIPCAQAQICHFWTLDLVYTVSKKVTRRRTRGKSFIETMELTRQRGKSFIESMV
ncbi:glycosyl transferase family group 2-domain-containing protein [Podospora appendiculata]|uniref:Glycosyl transferase family group 2-domain-containing protein n=1 Tax=Podospora appendiculata TaxID=314037 RepID=A0AAE0XHG2_9PEZI|nr:glycosyl transferase family group 2-domain-containing protein [Podospora appendiculata]